MSSIFMTVRLYAFNPAQGPDNLPFAPGPAVPPFSRQILRIVCLWASLASGIYIYAAERGWVEQYSLREWHAQDGLPSDDVTRVHQDRAGYLWLATARGLARFDGSYFENLGPELKKAGAAITIRAIVDAPGVGVMVAPLSGGTYVYREGRFVRLPFAADKVVNSFYAENDGTVWASCDDQSLLRWHAGQTQEFRPNDGSPHRLVAHFATDAAGRVWIAGATMIGRYESGQMKVVNEEFSGTEFRVASSGQGGPWVLTVDRLLKMSDDGPREIVGQLPVLAGAHYVSALHEDRRGVLWIGTRSQGLYAVVAGELRAVPTSGEAVTGICEDTEGDIWVTSNGGGLNRLRMRDFKIWDRSAGLGDNYSFSVSEDREGSMWFGNRDGGVARLRGGKIEKYSGWLGSLQISVSSVLPDGQGKIWVTTGSGVYKLDPESGTGQRMDMFPAKPSIGVAYVARNGDYWVSVNPDRVGRFRDGRLQFFSAADGYDAKAPRAITEDEQGRILIGSADGRLMRYDGNRFTRLAIDVKSDPDEPIQDIYCEAGTGLIWIATAGNGLYVLGGGRLRQILTKDGLIDSNITAILPDNQGYMWFGSSAGIFSLRREELADFIAGRISRLHPIIVGRDDGVHGLTCLGIYKPSAWKDRSGHLWFATRKGVVNFDPATTIAEASSPPPTVAGVKRDDETVTVSGDRVAISADTRKLSVRFSVLCLSTPDHVQLKYRLDGFDSQWVTAGPDRMATYPQLPPGTYRLRATASLGNGVWSEREPALVITVIPLWWQTVWFRLLAVTLLVALVVFFVRTLSHRRLRAHLARLEQESAIERERARIARNIHDDLGASLTRISLLTQTARRDDSTAESRQLGQIYETVRQITRSMDEIVWAVNPKNDNLDGLVSYLVSYAQSFLRVAGIRCRLDLPDSLPEASLTSNVRHNLYLCQKEALNNIVKHSGADEVTITMRVVASSFTYTISDNGRRDQPAGNGHGNGHANGHGDHHGLRVVTGQGLGNIAQRVAEMGGTYEFVPPSEQGGARLAITLLLGLHSGPGRRQTRLFQKSLS
jgi:signal transduction histidine kinase/ligand-binding sensor domain-containing protein